MSDPALLNAPTEGIGLIEGSVFEVALRHSLGATAESFFSEETAPNDPLPFITFLHALLLYERLSVDANFFDACTTHYWRLGFTREKYRASYWPTFLSATDVIGQKRDFSAEEAFVSLYAERLQASPTLQRFADQLQKSVRRDFSLRSDLIRGERIEPQGTYPSGRLLPDSLWAEIPEQRRLACGFLYRSLIYASFSQSYFEHHQIPIAYVASPGRMVAITEFLQDAETRDLSFKQKAYWDLIDGVPTTSWFCTSPRKYSFRFFKDTLDPIRFSAVSMALTATSPAEALKQVTEFRKTEEGQRLRRQWASRVWAHSRFAAEGVLNPAMTVLGATVGGDLSLVYNQTVFASANWMGSMTGKQQMTDVVSTGGAVEQRSNVEIEQIMSAIRAAGNVRQLIEVTGANLATIMNELIRLRKEMQKFDPGAKVELDRLAAAERAAQRGDGEGVIATLRGASRLVADFATKVGASVIAKIIETQAGW